MEARETNSPGANLSDPLDLRVIGQKLVEFVSRAYGISCQPEQVSCWQTGQGMSGARIWKVETEQEVYCLRRWPAEFQDSVRLDWLQSVLSHAKNWGCDSLAVPLPTRDGGHHVQAGGYLWQLSPWLPGEADYHRQPSQEKLHAAMRATASFHGAVADHTDSCVGMPPSVQERINLCRWWMNEGRLDELRHRIRTTSASSSTPFAGQIVAGFEQRRAEIAEMLAREQAVQIALMPCLRDLWHDHLLFDGEHVTGIIDYGALRIDTPATCISRLLASLAGEDAARWRSGLATYQEVRPMTENELRLVRVLDVSARLLSGMNWLKWIYLDERRFDNLQLVQQRLQLAAERLQNLVTGSHVWHRMERSSW